MKRTMLMKYAVASGGDSAMYSYVNTFWLFYMTTVAGIPPAAAGAVTAIGVVTHAAAAPFFAGWSDRSRHRLGRRRPFLLFSALPLGFFLCCMFAKLPLAEPYRLIALLLFGIGFWIAFAAFFIPHLAWGAEIAADYHERTAIRTFSFVMYGAGVLIGNALPTVVLDKFTAEGLGETAAWLLFTVILAFFSTGSILFTGASIREQPARGDRPLEKFSLKSLAADYWQVMKLRPLRLLTCAVAAFLIANTVIVADRMYVFTFKMGYSGTSISLIMIFFGLLGIALSAPMMKLAKRFDKRTMLVACLGVSGCLIFAMRFVGISSLPALLFFMCVFVTASTAYWQLIPAAFYDICEVDEYEN
ncbi:MAG: MFS transporter, partial [Clostridiales Family XIII bacterium]|nr:MFS transporter [Clostridiales Family XIII bacterium]